MPMSAVFVLALDCEFSPKIQKENGIGNGGEAKNVSSTRLPNNTARSNIGSRLLLCHVFPKIEREALADLPFDAVVGPCCFGDILQVCLSSTLIFKDSIES